MKRFLTLLLVLTMVADVHAHEVPPLWEYQPKDLAYFRGLGFEFSVDRTHHASERIADITVTFPPVLSDSGRARTFDSVSIDSDKISADLRVDDEAGKKHFVLVLSDELIRGSQLAFRYLGPADSATKGVMYSLDLSAIIKGNKPARRDERSPHRSSPRGHV